MKIARDPLRPWLVNVEDSPCCLVDLIHSAILRWRCSRLQSRCLRLSAMSEADPSPALREELKANLWRLAQLENGNAR